jgi:hypothetical protein
MDELEAQIRGELSAITVFLEERLGRRSRWNGGVELSDDAGTNGRAMWGGRVAINRQLARTDLRWRTEIHEALHLLSAGLTPQSYLDFQGWEEGVVEQLQRLFRSLALFSLNVTVPESLFTAEEAAHDYNRFIAALESLRMVLSDAALPFYVKLLATPLSERPAAIIRAGRQLPSDQFRGFQRTFGLAFSSLRGE